MTIEEFKMPPTDIEPPLPDDAETLKALVREQRARLASNCAEIEQLMLLIVKPRR